MFSSKVRGISWREYRLCAKPLGLRREGEGKIWPWQNFGLYLCCNILIFISLEGIFFLFSSQNSVCYYSPPPTLSPPAQGRSTWFYLRSSPIFLYFMFLVQRSLWSGTEEPSDALRKLYFWDDSPQPQQMRVSKFRSSYAVHLYMGELSELTSCKAAQPCFRKRKGSICMGHGFPGALQTMSSLWTILEGVVEEVVVEG